MGGLRVIMLALGLKKLFIVGDSTLVFTAPLITNDVSPSSRTPWAYLGNNSRDGENRPAFLNNGISPLCICPDTTKSGFVFKRLICFLNKLIIDSGAWVNKMLYYSELKRS